MRRRMAEQWNDFALHVLNNSKIGATQRIELRRAFYAGAFAIFSAVAMDLSPGQDTVTANDEQVLKDLAEEFKEYEKDLKAGRA